MRSPHQRTIAVAVISAAVVLLLAWAGYTIAGQMRVTSDKVRAYLHEVELKKLSGEARARALRKLAEMMNSLSGEERRIARFDKEWSKWFEEMTDDEKLAYLDATLPSGFKEMLGAFEKLTPEQRRRAVDDAMRRMKEAQNNPALAGDGAPAPQLSPDMQKKVTAMGLSAFYSQSSAQTKAEVAPLLEEIQKSMESGNAFRGKR